MEFCTRLSGNVSVHTGSHSNLHENNISLRPQHAIGRKALQYEKPLQGWRTYSGKAARRTWQTFYSASIHWLWHGFIGDVWRSRLKTFPGDGPQAGARQEATTPSTSSEDLEAQVEPAASLPTTELAEEPQQGAVLEPLLSASVEIAGALRLVTLALLQCLVIITCMQTQRAQLHRQCQHLQVGFAADMLCWISALTLLPCSRGFRFCTHQL
jgi:hypothetical protein